jgi:CheY-like chemotaxis protein
MRVLLAEKDAMSRRLAQLMLERLGHRVDLAANGLEAIRAVQQVQYDVVMMDDRMPELSGRHAAPAIRNEKPLGGQPVFVAVSAGDSGRDVVTGPVIGVDLVIAKPFRLGQLGVMLDRALVLAAERGNSAGGVPVAVDGQAAIRARLADMAGPDPGEDREVFSKILRSLARRGPADIELIHEAVRRSDHDAVADRAHALRGAVVTVGGASIGYHLEEVERRGRAREPVPEALLVLVRAEQARLGLDLVAVAEAMDRV